MIPLLIATVSALFSADHIAFLGYEGGSGPRVMILDVETGEVRRVGPDASAGAPAWSTDGKRLAFVVHGESDQIYVTGENLDEGRLLANDMETTLGGPTWSPKGSQLAYVTGEGLDSVIAVYDLETDTEIRWGGERTSLTSPVWVGREFGDFLAGSEEEAPSLRARLLPGTNREPVLLAVGYVGGPETMTTDLYVVTPDAATPLAVDRLPSRGAYTEWSTTVASDAVAFDSNDGGDREVFVVSRRGALDVSNHRAADTSPVWSPDEKWIAFESARSGVVGVYRAHRDTGRVEMLAAFESGACWAPTWSPTGDRLAFISDASGMTRLMIVGVRTRDHRVVSPEGLAVSSPSWRPRP